MTASALFFSIMAVELKRLAPELPQPELVFFRSVINLGWAVAAVTSGRGLFWPRDGKRLLVFRGVVGYAGVACMTYSISRLPLPVATLLNWCSPLFVIVLSRVFLRERMPRGSGWLIPLAFAGLLMILNPWQSAGHAISLSGVVVAVFAAFFGGTAFVAVRAATARVGPDTIVLYFVGVSTLISAPIAALGYVAPRLELWPSILAMGSCGAIGQLTMTRAYRHAPAGLVSTMSLLNPVFGAALGVWLFHESLRLGQWFGMLAIGGALAGLTGCSVLKRRLG